MVEDSSNVQMLVTGLSADTIWPEGPWVTPGDKFAAPSNRIDEDGLSQVRLVRSIIKQ